MWGSIMFISVYIIFLAKSIKIDEVHKNIAKVRTQQQQKQVWYTTEVKNNRGSGK